MGIIEGIRSLFELPQMQERSLDDPPDPGSILDIFQRRFAIRSGETWRYASIREAMSVPAVFGIVSTISNTVGSLSVDAFQNGAVVPPEDRPRLIIRPDPFQTPGAFYSESAYNLATRGEIWWWIAKRDFNGDPLSILNMAPQEVVVEETQDPLKPIIRWRDVEMDRNDVRQIVYTREPGERRGRGPLQACGAAISVAVESQRFAANYYGSGGVASIVIKHAGELSPTPDATTGLNEAQALKAQWIDSPNNVPKVIDQNIEDVKELNHNEAGGQMLLSRDFQVGEAARAFDYPMSLIGFAVAGSSLTYTNVGQELDKLTRTCLVPHYLEKMEQVLTDLLPRAWQCQFNVDSLKRSDEKARWEVYEIASRVLGPAAAAELARKAEGLSAGAVETAPVPFSVPQAIPTTVPLEFRSLRDMRCSGCGRLVGKVSGAAEIKCRCGTMNAA
jgi:phage portal protein BeeE